MENFLGTMIHKRTITGGQGQGVKAGFNDFALCGGKVYDSLSFQSKSLCDIQERDFYGDHEAILCSTQQTG